MIEVQNSINIKCAEFKNRKQANKGKLTNKRKNHFNSLLKYESTNISKEKF